MNDKQQVLNLFNQAEHHALPQLDRRSFCHLTGLSLIGFLLSGCAGDDTSTDLTTLSQEPEFAQFFDIIFPASSLGVMQYNASILTRVQRLPKEKAADVMRLYQSFKAHLWLKRDLRNKEYTKIIGETCMAELLHSTYAKQYNHALDIIYYELSKNSKLINTIWGRRFSLSDKKCIYWNSYDQAIS